MMYELAVSSANVMAKATVTSGSAKRNELATDAFA